MPKESQRILLWVAIGTLVLGVVGGIVQGLILSYQVGEKIASKANANEVPTLEEFTALSDEYVDHLAAQERELGTLQATLKGLSENQEETLAAIERMDAKNQIEHAALRLGIINIK